MKICLLRWCFMVMDGAVCYNCQDRSGIKVNKSMVSREKRRNSTANGKYVWVKAQAKAGGRKRRTPGNRRINDTLRWRVTELIKNEQWSPRQISGRLLRDGIHISHETIYGIIRKKRRLIIVPYHDAFKVA